MIIFGHTPREWKRRAKDHKWFIGALIISFVLGGIIIQMVAKKYQNPSGGLNQAGRDYFKRKEGSNLKSPVKKGNNPRRVSFAARFAANKGPMKDDKGRPTRLALALKAWGFGSKEAARNFANRNKGTA